MAEPRKLSTAKKATAGTAAAALLIATPLTARWEGKRNVTYADLVGVSTACYGHTGKDVGWIGKRWSDAQCLAMLDADLKNHMDGVIAAVPSIVERDPRVLASATVLTFNIGVGAFKRSTVASRFNAGRWREGCDAYLMWNRAGGKVVRGLANRREEERRLCLQGVG